MKNKRILDPKILHKTVPWTLRTVKKYLKLIGIDPRFQSPSRWSDQECRDFIDSLLLGFSFSKFILADAKSCAYSSSDPDHKGYYLGWYRSGTHYINIDSNNRISVALKKLFDGTLKLKRGSYRGNGKEIFEIKEGQTWNDLDKNVQKFILNIENTVDIITQSTPNQLATSFIRVNSGMRLNSAEERNAIRSFACDVCRTLADVYYMGPMASWILIGSEGRITRYKYNRRQVDAQFAGMLHLYTFGLGNKSIQRLDDGSLWEGYQEDSLMDVNAKIYKKDVGIFMATWIDNAEHKEIFKLLKEISQGTIYDLYGLYLDFNDTIPNMKLFIEKFVQVNNRLRLSKKQHNLGDGRSLDYSTLLRGRETDKCVMRRTILVRELKNELGTKSNDQQSFRIRTNRINNTNRPVLF